MVGFGIDFGDCVVGLVGCDGFNMVDKFYDLIFFWVVLILVRVVLIVVCVCFLVLLLLSSSSV